MQNNNLSKSEFSLFCDKFKLKRLERQRQVVSYNDEKYSFSVSFRTKPECRQTYEDCAGFITYIPDIGRYYLYDVVDFSKYGYSRVTRDGVVARSVKAELSEMTEIFPHAQKQNH